jgi:hypothetical protein
MDKHKFLREQYRAILDTDHSICDRWRSSFEEFLHDMFDRTPRQFGRRFLAPKNPDLGFTPDNVEWHFKAAVVSTPSPKSKPVPKLARVKAVLGDGSSKDPDRLRDERRKMISEQFRQWEAKQRMMLTK